MKRLAALSLVLSAAICAAVFPARAADEGAKSVDEAFIKAINANDVDAIVALYSVDATIYPPDTLEVSGTVQIRKMFEGMLRGSTISNFNVTATHYRTDGNLSAGRGRFVMTMTPKAGGPPMTVEGRFTDVCEKIGGKWLYVDDHASFPVGPPPQPKKE